MLILGVHGGSKFEDEDDPTGFAMHDSAAVVIRDGRVIAAFEEERLNRIKHSNAFPMRAIAACLREAHASLADIDVVAVPCSERFYRAHARLEYIRNSKRSSSPDGRTRLSRPFAEAFDCDIRDKLFFCNHHLAHSWSAIEGSGFDESLILCLDGDGEAASGSVTEMRQKLTFLREFSLPQSLGHFYENLISFLGYRRFDEYKVMGLAPYGDPSVFRALFRGSYALLPNGEYHIESLHKWFQRMDAIGLVSKARKRGGEILQTHKDFAAALQASLEEIVMHVVRHFKLATGHRNLCLAGGVAHNCSMNGIILRSGLFEQVFVQPASHDAGGALGAAVAAWHTTTGCRLKSPAGIYWGTDVGNADDVLQTLKMWQRHLTWSRRDDICLDTAALIAQGSVIAWVQGRAEFGPRALGNRSILADPRPESNKGRINAIIKNRESYRPFAPSILEEELSRFFEVPSIIADFAYMTFVLRVRPEARDRLGATTHVDGTSRVQTVSRSTNPKYWALIKAFGELTGTPAVLNTSLNNDSEPIVDSLDDAIQCFLTTELDYLIADDFLICKRPTTSISETILPMAPILPPTHKLVARRSIANRLSVETPCFSIESVKSDYFGTTKVDISEEMYRIMQFVDGSRSLLNLMALCGLPEESRLILASEFFSLWQRRMLRVRSVDVN